MIGTQIAYNPNKPQQVKHQMKYATSVTVCIAAICSENGAEPIILCSDRKLSFGRGSGSTQTGFKLNLAGPGWSALIAGSVSEANRILSFYRPHLERVALNEDNFLTEITLPFTLYRNWLANQYIQATYSVTIERLLESRSSTRLGKERNKILKEAQSVEFEEQLLITGYLGRIPHLITVSCSGVVEHRDFACIGSGAWLSQSALLHREFSNSTDIDEALYLVYEAKKFSEKDDYVGSKTLMFVQQYPENSPEPVVMLRTVSHDGLAHLEKQYRLFGLQPWQPTPYNQPRRFYV